MQFKITFTPAAPSSSAGVFSRLVAVVTDSTGAVNSGSIAAAQIDLVNANNGDGTYTVAVDVPNVSVGPYTGVAQALNSSGAVMGSELPFSGTVTIEEGGAWFAQPTAVAD